MRNLAASVQQRLRNAAAATGRPLQEVIQYYGMERFLYRLSQSPHSERFLLKGALMLSVWHGGPPRATRDIDVKGLMENSQDEVRRAIRDICGQAVQDDGMVFDPATVEADTILEDGVYQGIRARFWGALGTIRIRMRVDVGFGDPVVDAPAPQHYPTILDFPAPVLMGYSPESSIAEKLEAMVKLGLVNSRMKDYYDIRLLAGSLDFRGETLAEALRQTFDFRGTELVIEPQGLTREYADYGDHRLMWHAFLQRHQVKDADLDLTEAITAVREFLLPVLMAVVEGKPFAAVWRAPGPWKPA